MEIIIRDNHHLSDRFSPDEVVEFVRTGRWKENEILREILLKEGKYLTFEYMKDDLWFLSFFLYHNKQRKKELKDGSKRTYLNDLRQFLEFIQKPLTELGYVELDHYQEWIVGKYAKSTARKKLTMVRSLLKFGYEYHFFSEDMRKYIQVPEKVATGVDRKLTYEEVQKIIDIVRGHPVNHVVIVFLLLTGLRVSELCNLRWGNIQPGLKGHLNLHVMGKGDKQRKVRLRKDLYALILEHRHFFRLSLTVGEKPEEPLLVNSYRRPLTDRGVRYMIEHAVRKAGIIKWKKDLKEEQKVSPHWLRHSAATFALDGGANIDEVSRMLGHADLSTTKIYLHDLEDEKSKAANDYITGIQI